MSMHFMKAALALAAAAALPTAASAQSITFNLAGLSYDSGSPITLTLPGIAGAVSGVTYTIGTAPQNGSWAAELSVELSSPSGTLPAPIFTSATPGGWIASTPSDAGTIVWATSPGPTWNMGVSPDVNLGFPSSATASSLSGASAKLNGLGGAGTWTLRIFDSYDDTGTDGVLSANSFITVSFVPEPGTYGLMALGLVGVALAARRRG